MRFFINPTEHRLRAFWRLLIQLVLFLLAVGAANLLAVFALAFALALAGQIPFAALGGVPALSQAVTAQMTRLPVLMVLRTLITLALMLGLFALLARWLDRRPTADYGLRLNAAWWRDFGFGLALGGLLMTLIFAVERAAGWVEVTGQFQILDPSLQMTAGWGLAILLAHYVLVGAQEELLSRGYQLRNLAEGLNLPGLSPRAAVLIAFGFTSALFGLLHLGNPNATWTSSANIALAGLLLGLGFVLTGELAIPIGLHISWNFFQGNVFGFPVSGMASQVSMLAIRQSGPDLWTGGAFGPEGGLLAVLVMLAGLALIWGWVCLTRGQAGIHTGLAVYRPRARQEAIARETDERLADQTG